SLLEDQDYIRSFLATSRARLLHNRLAAESLLSEAGVAFHDRGNAGLFMWIDLGPFLPVAETGGDGWAAQKLIAERLVQAGVVLQSGETYRAPRPGWFRLTFSLDEESMREGIRRRVPLPSARSVVVGALKLGHTTPVLDDVEK
ncbi:hypothetical protein EKO27_g11869, partial [Xylaria grammica]